MITTKKKLIALGLATYCLAVALVLIMSYVWYVYLPDIEDWEFFSYNFFGAFIIYGLAIIPYLLFASFANLKKIKSYMIILILLLNVELIALLVSGDSFVVGLFTGMKENDYTLIMYPVSIIISYLICKPALKINFKTG